MRNDRALDESVAEHVLKWRKEAADRWIAPDSAEARPLPRFSRDIAAAWLLADRIGDQGFTLQLSGKKLWSARFYKSVAHTLETRALSATGGSPAEAICLAALAIVGVEPPKA
jgi:hypothetical protein